MRMATLRRYRSMNQSIVEAFEPLFYPKSLATIGASSDMAKFGNIILSAIMEIGYVGKIYPINPEGGEIKRLLLFLKRERCCGSSPYH